MTRPTAKPSGLSKAPRKEHPVAPEHTREEAPARSRDPKVPAGGSRLSTVIPAQLHKVLKIKSVESGRSLQDVVAEALQEWVDRN